MISLPDRMNNQRLQKLIEQVAEIEEGRDGFWHIRFQDRAMWVITDEAHDRMRLITPVASEESLTDQDRQILLSANFDRALDARYAVSRGYVWSAYLHPLSTLTDSQFLDAIQQVDNLAQNYGSSYASTKMVFDGDLGDIS